ncbi:MAG: aldo/keto reductase [Actinobacteria bacterium]|nr:aldo/keto reductase [Actinomycetota bacterium]
MEQRRLGATGITVSAFALGAMSFGPLGNTDVDDCVRIVHAALDRGVNVVDTADIYSGGESERIVGRALADRRDDVVLASKCFWPMGPDANRAGSSRRWIVRACEESLTRLGTDHLDVYYLHKPDPATDLDESLGAMSDLVHQGKVRAVGISTFPSDGIVDAVWTSERRHRERPRVEQPPYSILNRGIERDVLPTCARYGLGVMVWGPLNGGFLTGKYTGTPAPGDSRAVRWERQRATFDQARPEVQRKHAIVAALGAVADDAGISLTHLALAFAAEHPAVSSVLIGPRTAEQLDDLLDAADLVLDAEVLDAVDALVPPGIDVDPVADAGWTRPWLAEPAARRRVRGARGGTS